MYIEHPGGFVSHVRDDIQHWALENMPENKKKKYCLEKSDGEVFLTEGQIERPGISWNVRGPVVDGGVCSSRERVKGSWAPRSDICPAISFKQAGITYFLSK